MNADREMGARGEPALRQFAGVLLAAALLSYMTLSAPALFVLGMPYDVPFGSFAAKIHPGSYLLVASYAVGLASHGNPLRVALAQAAQEPLLTLYLAAMLCVFAWAAWRQGTSGLAFIIDTLWMPAFGAFSMLLQPPRWRQRLLAMLMLLLALNAAIAIGEAALHERLVPLAAGHGERVAEAFFRSSALLGHPLLNALVTVSLMPAVGLLPWRRPARLALYALLVLALLAFGGRATIAGLGVYLLMTVLWAAGNAVRGRFSYLQCTGGLLAVVLGCSLMAALVAGSGLGERVFQNFSWDGSADTRLRIWELLDLVDDLSLWIGMPVSGIDHLAQRVGLDPRYEAIENFWLYLLLLFGVIGFVPFVIGIAALTLHLWCISGAAMRAGVLVYFFVASGANTLASKSVSLLLLTVAAQGAARRPMRVAEPFVRRRIAIAVPATGSFR